MSITRRLDELIAECGKRDIAIPTSEKKLKRRDYVKLLGDNFLSQQYPDGNIPKHLQFVRSLESFMLCFRYDECKPEVKEELWKDNNEFLFTEKINGCRMMLTYSPEEGLHFYSRNTSVETYLPIDYASNIWLPNFHPEFLPQLGITDFILDGEILSPESKINTNLSGKMNDGVVTEAALNATSALLATSSEESIRVQQIENLEFRFHIFHLISLNGKSYVDCPMGIMIGIMDEAIKRIKQCGLKVVEVKSTRINKKDFYREIINAGGEGVVAKNLNESYRAIESRSHRAWIKIKRLASETLANEGLGDTIDGFVTGFIPGNPGTNIENKVGSLIFSIFVRKADGEFYEHEIAQISGLTDEERDQLTELDFLGNPVLKQEWYNRVGEIDGQCISGRNKKLMHPRLIRFRSDKGKDQCWLNESSLNKMILE